LKQRLVEHGEENKKNVIDEAVEKVLINGTRGQSNLTKSASLGAHSPVRGQKLYH